MLRNDENELAHVTCRGCWTRGDGGSRLGQGEEGILGLYTRQHSSCLCSAFLLPHSFKRKYISPAAPLLPEPPPRSEKRFLVAAILLSLRLNLVFWLGEKFVPYKFRNLEIYPI